MSMYMYYLLGTEDYCANFSKFSMKPIVPEFSVKTAYVVTLSELRCCGTLKIWRLSQFFQVMYDISLES